LRVCLEIERVCAFGMAWIDKQLEPTSAHLLYLILSIFLILYALFSQFIRNRLHLSEPPLATLVGIAFGPRGAGLFDPKSWGWEDNVTQEASRIIVGVQVFAVGVELPRKYFKRHWKSVAILLGPVMTYSWLVTALLIFGVLGTEFSTALIISACLAPTDPVLAASVLNASQFSSRVPKRLRHMLSAESGSNDGVSFPFLYVGLYVLIEPTAASAIKEWILDTILWKCLFGTLIGLFVGVCANRTLRFAHGSAYIATSFFFVFYFLLAILCVGIGSTLGTDDFLVSFGAGTGFAWDGWFGSKTKETRLPEILDLMLNSSMFVYFGAIIPWSDFGSSVLIPHLTVGRLIGLLILIILFRRIPIVVAMKRFIPDVKTYREALFCGHFGPMGVGAIFLVIEARAQLETETSLPLPHPPLHHPHQTAILTIWPVVCFIILGSIMIHGLSVAAISVGGHYSRAEGERAPLIGGEVDELDGMEHEGGAGEVRKFLEWFLHSFRGLPRVYMLIAPLQSDSDFSDQASQL
jgi:NhaP-type Na+/H+ or K+/H+ antiporter